MGVSMLERRVVGRDSIGLRLLVLRLYAGASVYADCVLELVLRGWSSYRRGGDAGTFRDADRVRQCNQLGLSAGLAATQSPGHRAGSGAQARS